MKRGRDIAAAVQGGRLDPVALAREAAAACIASQDRLNALTVIDGLRAEAEAATIPARLAAGETMPLAGVPIVVKDNIWVGGWQITQGSMAFRDHVAPRDALCVERARKAGAVVVAIGHCPEFACKGNTRSPLHGVTHHPMDPDLTPGGSSGGNVAIVAAGAVPMSIGTDGGGSSRRPPAHCGLVGFKPSYGAIPHPFGFAEPFWWITSISPITLDVADATLLYAAMAGPDLRDPESRIIAPPRHEDVKSLRLAWHPTLGLDAPVDPDVAEACERAVAALRQAGLRLAIAAPAWPAPSLRASLAAIQFAGLAALHGEAYRRAPELTDPDVAVQIEQGFAAKGTDVALGLEASQQIRRALGAFFTEHDLLLSPTTPCVAWPHAQLGPPEIGGRPVDSRGHAAFTPFFNHGQNPAISIPCGRGRDGLPVGLQIAGAVGEDYRVLAFAAEAERILAEAGLWTGLT
ncbi:MAG: amidase [Beijerinckiaceae bacterium]|nr:amidase [Beijerinckiaceae bacterium]